MRRRNLIGLAVVCGFGLLAALGLAATLVVPRFIDLDKLRDRIVAQLGTQGVTATIHTLHFAVWPVPHVALDEVSVSMPGAVAVTADSVSIYPRVLPLFIGTVQLAKVRVTNPNLEVQLPAAPREDSTPTTGVDGAAAALAAVVSATTAQAPGLVLVVEDGRVGVFTGNESQLLVTNLNADVGFLANQLRLDLRCASNLWSRMSLHAAFDPTAPLVTAEVLANDLDIELVQHVAAVLVGDVAALHPIFNVLHSGKVPEIVIESRAAALADLTGRDALAIHGSLIDGRINVPGVHLELAEVAGHASVVNGVLIGERVSARLGKSQASAATLRIGLAAETRDVHVETTAQADARELQALLLRLVGDATLTRELSRLTDVDGAVAGRLVLDGTTKDVSATAEMSHLKMSAHLDGIDQRLHIEGGPLSYEQRRFAANNLNVRIGASTSSQLSGQIDANEVPPSFELTSGASRVVLDEVYPWLAASDWLNDSPESPTPLIGTVALDAIHLSGPVGSPSDWRLELSGAAESSAIDSPALRERFALRNAPSFSDLHLQRDRVHGTSLSGKLTTAPGLTGAFDVTWNADELNVRRFSIHDAQSDASLTLLRKERRMALSFAGHVGKTTLDALLVNHDALAGEIQGDLRAEIRLDQPRDSTVEGKLEARNIFLPGPDGSRIRIEHVALDAHAGAVNVDAAVDAFGEGDVHLHGVVTPSPESFNLALDATTDHLEWEKIAPLLQRSAASDDSMVASRASWNLALGGTLNVATEAFTYGRFTWKPVHAVVNFAASGGTVTVNNADLCGIATPGTIVVTSQGLDLSFKPLAEKQQLATTLACLGEHREPITGQYSLRGELNARGQPAEIGGALNGHLQLRAANGRVARVGPAAKLFSVLSAASGSVASWSELTKEGLAYDHIEINADLQGHVLTLREAVLDGPSMKIVGEGSVDVARGSTDLTLLVAPLKTVDSVVSSIPLISDVLGGSLVSIPVKVSGGLNDPDVVPLAPAAVGGRLLGVMTRTLKLPFSVIQPIFSGGRKR